MDTELRYRGRIIGSDQVAQIAELIAAEPGTTRRALSLLVCEAWNWKQPNGALCDALCRGLLLTLHRAGHIALPEPTWRSTRPARRSQPQPVELHSIGISGSSTGWGWLRRAGRVLRHVG